MLHEFSHQLYAQISAVGQNSSVILLAWFFQHFTFFLWPKMSSRASKVSYNVHKRLNASTWAVNSEEIPGPYKNRDTLILRGCNNFFWTKSMMGLYGEELLLLPATSSKNPDFYIFFFQFLWDGRGREIWGKIFQWIVENCKSW